MNLLILANKLPYPPKDGGAFATLSLALSIANAGHKVTILALNTSKHYFDIEQIPTEISDKIRFIDSKINSDVSIFGLLRNLFFSKLPYNAERFISANFRHKLIDLLYSETFDIVQLEGLYLAPYIVTIRSFSKTTIAMRAHNVEHEIWERIATNTKNIFKRKYFETLAKRIQMFEKELVNDSDLIVPISTKDAQFFSQFAKNKPFHICQTGIDISEITENKLFDIEVSLFYIGGLDWIPNQEGIAWFIDNCWTYFVEKYPDFKFYIAGRNAPKSFVKKLKFKNIIYLGEVESSEEFIRSKAIMIVPLFSGSGMRIKIIEAMSFGKAVISTNIGAEGIQVIHNENILIANTANEFIHQIEKLIHDKTLYNKLCINAKQFIVENFDNQKIVDELMRFYSNPSIY